MTSAAVFSSEFLSASCIEEANKLFLSGNKVCNRRSEDSRTHLWSRVRALTVLLWLFDVVTKFLASNRRAARDIFVKSLGYLFLSWPTKYGCNRSTLHVNWAYDEKFSSRRGIV